MHGKVGVGAVVMGVGGMEATGGEVMEVGGMEATSGQALGWVSASVSGHSGGRIGGHTGGLMPTPMATRPLSPCHPPKSMCNPQHRPPPSPLPQCIGTTATKLRGTTPMSSSAQGAGGRSPLRRHNPETTGPRAHHPVG
jgi:hypothetical protein